MGFRPTAGVRFPRCLGNGGVPVLQTHAAEDPVPPPGAWEARGYLDDGRHWARFGFAVLDLDGPRIDVRYLDETGDLVRAETIA
jgi:predicted esterase